MRYCSNNPAYTDVNMGYVRHFSDFTGSYQLHEERNQRLTIGSSVYSAPKSVLS